MNASLVATWLAAVTVALAVTAAALLMLAPASFAHPERRADFPDPSTGSVPEVRDSAAQILTVCKPDSGTRIRRAFRDDPRRCAPGSNSSSSAASATSRRPSTPPATAR